MKLEGKNVIVIGMAKTGISVVKKLIEKKAVVTITDMKSKADVLEIIEELGEEKIDFILGRNPSDEEMNSFDFAVVSPGVPKDLPYIINFIESGKSVIGEIELAYKMTKGNFLGITGTNGKTTTTTLVGEIFKEASIESWVVGNIGNPVIDVAEKATDKSWFITELSSFQLESIDEFRPKVAGILNITPDHLNRHKTMENYISAKCDIFKNQSKDDFAILNWDCEEAKKLSAEIKSQVIFFSRKEKLNRGVFVEGENIISNIFGEDVFVMKTSEIYLPGSHNLENALGACALSICAGIKIDVIREVLKTFKGVEHRLEFVKDVNGVSYVNDSKGTNPDASIKAVQAYQRPIILIAGGMDKGSDFTSFIEAFGGKVKDMILLGETAEKIETTARKLGFENNHRVKNMEEAVLKAFELGKEGDVVLLSPACASWDMYPSYEVRGQDFKDRVNSL